MPQSLTLNSTKRWTSWGFWRLYLKTSFGLLFTGHFLKIQVWQWLKLNRNKTGEKETLLIVVTMICLHRLYLDQLKNYAHLVGVLAPMYMHAQTKSLIPPSKYYLLFGTCLNKRCSRASPRSLLEKKIVEWNLDQCEHVDTN